MTRQEPLTTTTTTNSKKSQPPDNAYYLLIGLAVAITLTTVGCILIYIGFWPQIALSHLWKQQQREVDESTNNHSGTTIFLNNNKTTLEFPNSAEDQIQEEGNNYPNPNNNNNKYSYNDHNYYYYNYNQHSFLFLRIFGPILTTTGLLLLIAIIIISTKINCDKIPDTTSVNFVKLKSELSLNLLFDNTNGVGGGGNGAPRRSRYELMVPIEMENRRQEVDSKMGQQESQEIILDNFHDAKKIHIIEIL